MVEYDPRIIQQFADRLYRKATTAIVLSTILGVLFGGAGGFTLGLSTGALLAQDSSSVLSGAVVGLVGGLVGAVLFALMGFLGGRERAFRLRLQAQTALCQLKIEENTRRAPAAAGRLADLA
ncbi:MAG: hypothetical protein JW900_04760 [Anaerolineae bacterium]|nr:hypothetical protein [Anaerolineae bacterium]